MKRMVFPIVVRVIVLLFVLNLVVQTACGRENETDPKGERKVNCRVEHGVCRSPMYTVKDVLKLAENIKSVEIPLVRINGVNQGTSMSQMISNIKTFHSKGIKVHLIFPLHNLDIFPIGYQMIPGPKFKSPRLANIDLTRYQAFVDQFVSSIRINIPKDAIVGIELFNEINWGGFNADLRTLDSGRGEVFDMKTSLSTPSFADFYKGIGNYGECLRILKETLNKQVADRNIKVVTAGLVFDGKHNNYEWARNNGYTIVDTELFFTLLQGKHPKQENETDYLQYADAIGVHCYPRLEDDMIKLVGDDYFNDLNSYIPGNKPYWITEWGFSRDKFMDIGGETKRLFYINKFINAIESFKRIELATFYDFDNPATSKHNIWENGKLLESGTFFQWIE